MYLQSFDQEGNKDELISVQICEAAALQSIDYKSTW